MKTNQLLPLRPTEPISELPSELMMRPGKRLPASELPHQTKTASTLRGNWHYRKEHSRWTTLFLSGLVSVGVHTVLLVGFNPKPGKVQPLPADPPFAVNLLKLPEIPDEDEAMADLDKSGELVEGIDVPRQADLPTTVVLDNVMTQAYDPRSLQPHFNLTGTKIVVIPSNLRVGGTGGKGMRQIFNLADLDRPPAPFFQPPPNIPPALRQAGIIVNLTVEFIVSSKGEVVDIRILTSTDHRYDDIATGTVLKWRFKPGIKRGRPVATRILQPFVVKISDADQ